MSDPSHLKINSIEYIIQAPLGQGTFGKVYKAQQFSSKKVVAIKVQNQINESEKALLLQFKEKNFKNLVNIYDYEEQNNYIYIVMEYCSHSLYDQIQKQLIQKIQDTYSNKFQMAYMSFIHRVWLIEIQNQKIYSYVNSRIVAMCKKCINYVTSELLKTHKDQQQHVLVLLIIQLQNNYNNKRMIKVLIYGLQGLLCMNYLQILLFFRYLYIDYEGSTVLQIYDKIKNYEINAQIDNLNDLDIKYKNLLKSMLKKNPQERISIEEIRQKIEERVSMSVERKPQTNPANCQFKELKSLNLSKPINIPGQIQGQKPPLNLNVYPKKQPQFQQPNNTQPPILQNQLQNFNQNTQTQNQNLKQFQIPSEFQWQQRRSVPELAQNSSKIGK